MKSTLLVAVAVGAMAFGTGPLLAQSLDNEQRTFEQQITNPETNRPLTAADIDPADPFGDLEVDMDADIEPGQFDEIQLAELKQRCEFIVDNPETFGPKPASFCEGKVQGLTQ